MTLMIPISPALVGVFDDQRAQQQQLVQVALIQRNVSDVVKSAHRWFDQLMTRGEELERLEMHAQTLVAESELFRQQSRGAWRWCLCFPAWWCVAAAPAKKFRHGRRGAQGHATSGDQKGR